MTPDPPPPAPPPPPTTRRPRVRGLLLALSLCANLVILAALILVVFADSAGGDGPSMTEEHYSGDRAADDKVAIIRVSGVIAEGFTEYAHRQIEQAARDERVKAVVLRIDSPGGTVSASDALYRDLVHLRDDTQPRYAGTGPKPIVVSMGAIAASGGYYIAMPGRTIYAEPTTITGSIGVFVALPNVSELAHNNGVKVELIKAGDIKAGGSMFHPLTPEERQPWQDMVNHAYDRFLTVVADGRPGLTRPQLVADKIVRGVTLYDDKGKPVVGPDGKPSTVTQTRYRADGGTFTPPQAKELGLIDEIGDLTAAIQAAAEIGHLSNFRAVQYERPKGLVELLLGAKVSGSGDPSGFMATLSAPRLWYLTPGYELSGMTTTAILP